MACYKRRKTLYLYRKNVKRRLRAKEQLMKKDWLFWALLLMGAGLVLYLSWVPRPQMATVWFVPNWVAHWADQTRNDTIRTAVPLVALGWLVGSWLAAHHWPRVYWLLAWVALVALVTMAEVGQLFLRHRSFDLGDIGWGAVGALLGLGTVAVLRGLYLVARSSRV